MKGVFYISVIVSVLIACGAKKDGVSSTTKKKEAKYEETIKLIATTGQFEKVSDPIMAIDTVIVNGNTMFIELRYGGGCEKHDFKVIGSLAIAKSYPPIRSLQLVHHAHNDKCRAIVKSVLEVNLKDVAYQQKEGSEIYFHIDGYDHRIYYKYTEK